MLHLHAGPDHPVHITPRWRNTLGLGTIIILLGVAVALLVYGR